MSFDNNYMSLVLSGVKDEHDRLICLYITFFYFVILSSGSINNLFVVTFAKIKYFTHFLMFDSELSLIIGDE
jgi:hypothetical protein